MTYLRRPRKDDICKPPAIRCKSGRNVVDAETMVVQVEQLRNGAGLTPDDLRSSMDKLLRASEPKVKP